MGKVGPGANLLEGARAAAAETGGIHDADADARRHDGDLGGLAVARREAHCFEGLISAENMANHKPSARNR